MITLFPYAHTLWGEPAFALKRIRVSDNMTEMELEFYWLVTPATLSTAQNEPALKLSDKPVIFHPPNSSMEDMFTLSGRRLLSGDKIILRTADPERMPLPSFDILELQWFLHQVSAMRAAAEPKGYDKDDKNPDFRVSSWLTNQQSSLSHPQSPRDQSLSLAGVELPLAMGVDC